MKRILIIIIFIIFLVSCDSDVVLKIEDINIASNIENQIQHIDEFRLDKIVLDIKYDKDRSQHKVLSLDMIDKFEKKVGYQEIKIKNSDFKISLMLYDDEFIKNNYIYYYDDVICYCDSIYNLKAPVKGSMYFTGWYIDEACSVKYKERESRINKIYPRFSEYAMYNVDFYLEDKIIDRQWVLPGAKYDSVEVNGEFEFVRWEPYVLGVYSDLRLDAVILKEDECLVDFYEGNQLIDYRVVKKGSSVEIDDPIKQGYEFIGWDKELVNVCENMVVNANFIKIYTVNFYSNDGVLLEIDYVREGESASFNNYSDKYIYNGFSKDFSCVNTDMNIYVFTTPYLCSYYIGDDLYKTAYSNEYVEPPKRYGLLPDYDDGLGGVWEKISKGKYIYKLVPKGMIFHLFLDNGTNYILDRDSVVDGKFECEIFDQINKYIKYEWYYDSNYTDKLEEGLKDNIVLGENEVTLYGKMVKLDTNPKLDITYNVDTQVGLLIPKDFNYDYCFVEAKEYYIMDLDSVKLVDSMSTMFFDYYETVIIGKNISSIIGIDEFNSRKFETAIKYILVDKNNPYFYSEDGNLYDKLTGELLIDLGDKKYQ